MLKCDICRTDLRNGHHHTVDIAISGPDVCASAAYSTCERCAKELNDFSLRPSETLEGWLVALLTNIKPRITNDK